MDTPTTITTQQAFAGQEVECALIDGDAIRPLPGGWHVIFTKKPCDPSTLVGKLAVVYAKGHKAAMLREIRRGSTAGLYSLHNWVASPIEDVEIDAAHAVLSITAP